MNRALQIHRRLLEAYGESTWRSPLPAIDELVSTILSQNTYDINRARAFGVLRAAFPIWETAHKMRSHVHGSGMWVQVKH